MCNPSSGKKGVGERLLAQAESTFQQFSNREHKKVEICLQLGQRAVLRWFLDRGYVPKDDQSRVDSEAVLDHPERFVFETAIIDSEDGFAREDAIFKSETISRNMLDTVRINLQKVLSPE